MMDAFGFKTKSAGLCIAAIFFLGGCANLPQVSLRQRPESALPEQIYQQPKKNYYTASKLLIFPFAAPVNHGSVGTAAANLLYQKLLHAQMFYAVSFQAEEAGQSLDAQMQRAQEEGFDLMLTGRVLNYLAGTNYQNSRVDEEIRVLNVKTKEVLWHAAAVEVGEPVPERDHYLFQTEGQSSPSATSLLAANGDKFVRMLQWTAPEFSAFSEDMQLVDLGYNHMLAQNNAKATYYFEQALEVNPDNPYALLDLGVMFEREGRLAEAAVLYQRVIDLDPTELVAESTRPTGIDLTLAAVAKDNLSRLNAAEKRNTPQP